MRIILTVIAVAIVCARPLAANAQRISYSDVDLKGSAPPMPRLYDCAHELQGKPYSQSAADACVQKIVHTGYFLSGKVRTEQQSDGTIRLRLELVAPDLRLLSIDYSLAEAEKAQLLASLSKDANYLYVGDAYDHSKEQILLQRMKSWFDSTGRSIEISAKIMLNYPNRTAQLQFTFYNTGVDQGASRTTHPNSERCKDEIEELNLTDADDQVPLVLVNRLIETRAFSCFQAPLIERDTATLRQTNLFRQVKFHVEGKRGARRISLEIRGNPLRVREVLVRNSRTGEVRDLPEIPLRVGSIYSRAAARKSADILANQYVEPDHITHVYQEVRQISDDTVRVEFSVLICEPDSLVINGQEVP